MLRSLVTTALLISTFLLTFQTSAQTHQERLKQVANAAEKYVERYNFDAEEADELADLVIQMHELRMLLKDKSDPNRTEGLKLEYRIVTTVHNTILIGRLLLDDGAKVLDEINRGDEFGTKRVPKELIPAIRRIADKSDAMTAIAFSLVELSAEYLGHVMSMPCDEPATVSECAAVHGHDLDRMNRTIDLATPVLGDVRPVLSELANSLGS